MQAAKNGKEYLKQLSMIATEYGIFDFIRDLLQSGCLLREVKMGEPPGSRGIAYRVLDPVRRELYIKVKIEEGTLWVVSFHRSKH